MHPVNTRKRRRGRRLLLWLPLLILAAALFLWSQQNWLQVETVSVPSPRLPPEMAGLKIVQLSDLHGKQFGTDSEKLLAAVAAQKPDLIALTGDIVDQPHQVEFLPALARGLSAIAPTYYVTGNHEWAARCVTSVRKILAENGVIPLSNTYALFSKNGATIAVAGVDDPNGPYGQPTPQAVLDGVRETWGEGYVLLLAHRNDETAAYEAAGPDLVLCGHGHGGMIRLPFFGGLLGNRREFFPKNTQGLCPLWGTDMVVSRGLGNNTVPFRSLRLFNRPELLNVVLGGN